MPNLGYVRSKYTEYYVLQLCRLVVKLFAKLWSYFGLGGVVA